MFGICVERAPDPSDVLRVVAEVDADEGGLRVALDDAVARLQQGLARRVLVRVAEPPGLVVFELHPALVLVVVWEPERLRVGDVDRDRHAQLATALPDRVELRVVDLDQLASLVSKVESEALVFFQPRGALAVPLLDLPQRMRFPVRPVPVRVVEVHVVDEAPRRDTLGARDVLGELRYRLHARDRSVAAQVGADADACGIHDPDGTLDPLISAGDVHVQVDDALFCAPRGSFFPGRLIGGRRLDQQEDVEGEDGCGCRGSHNSGCDVLPDPAPRSRAIYSAAHHSLRFLLPRIIRGQAQARGAANPVRPKNPAAAIPPCEGSLGVVRQPGV